MDWGRGGWGGGGGGAEASVSHPSPHCFLCRRRRDGESLYVSLMATLKGFVCRRRSVELFQIFKRTDKGRQDYECMIKALIYVHSSEEKRASAVDRLQGERNKTHFPVIL